MAYLHSAEEHRAEVTDSGFELDALISVETFGWMLGNLETYLDEPANLLRAARLAESEPSMLGVGAHLISVSSKPSQT